LSNRSRVLAHPNPELACLRVSLARIKVGVKVLEPGRRLALPWEVITRAHLQEPARWVAEQPGVVAGETHLLALPWEAEVRPLEPAQWVVEQLGVVAGETHLPGPAWEVEPRPLASAQVCLRLALVQVRHRLE
jgi:hypothetical protein